MFNITVKKGYLGQLQEKPHDPVIFVQQELTELYDEVMKMAWGVLSAVCVFKHSVTAQ